MSTWQKFSIFALAAVFATATGVAVAAPSHRGQTAAVRPASAAAVPASAAAVAPVDRAVESRFTAITPCRIVDTRYGGGGPLTSTKVRDFYATGTSGFTTQGGTDGGCGIPSAATAVDVVVQSLNSAGRGYITEAAYGTPFSNTALLHYLSGQTIGSGATLPVNGTGTYSFSLQSPSIRTTDVVIDAVGYFVKPMTATVDKTGALLFGSRVVSVSGQAGSYDVRFDRSVVGCNYQTTAFTTPAGLVVSAGLVTATTNTILVRTTVNGALTAATFYLSVTC